MVIGLKWDFVGALLDLKSRIEECPRDVHIVIQEFEVCVEMVLYETGVTNIAIRHSRVVQVDCVT